MSENNPLGKCLVRFYLTMNHDTKHSGWQDWFQEKSHCTPTVSLLELGKCKFLAMYSRFLRWLLLMIHWHEQKTLKITACKNILSHSIPTNYIIVNISSPQSTLPKSTVKDSAIEFSTVIWSYLLQKCVYRITSCIL